MRRCVSVQQLAPAGRMRRRSWSLLEPTSVANGKGLTRVKEEAGSTELWLVLGKTNLGMSQRMWSIWQREQIATTRGLEKKLKLFEPNCRSR